MNFNFGFNAQSKANKEIETAGTLASAKKDSETAGTLASNQSLFGSSGGSGVGVASVPSGGSSLNVVA